MQNTEQSVIQKSTQHLDTDVVEINKIDFCKILSKAREINFWRSTGPQVTNSKGDKLRTMYIKVCFWTSIFMHYAIFSCYTLKCWFCGQNNDMFYSEDDQKKFSATFSVACYFEYGVTCQIFKIENGGLKMAANFY